MRIRCYRDGDFLDLEKILKKTNLYESEFDQRENYKLQIDHDPTSILVAAEDEKIVGAVISIYNPFASFIFHLCVDPEYQNKGIGTKLMDKAEENLLARGVNKPIIYVGMENRKVVDFYKKRNWDMCPSVIPMVKKLEGI